MSAATPWIATKIELIKYAITPIIYQIIIKINYDKGWNIREQILLIIDSIFKNKIAKEHSRSNNCQLPNKDEHSTYPFHSSKPYRISNNNIEGIMSTFTEWFPLNSTQNVTTLVQISNKPFEAIQIALATFANHTQACIGLFIMRCLLQI